MTSISRARRSIPPQLTPTVQAPEQKAVLPALPDTRSGRKESDAKAALVNMSPLLSTASKQLEAMADGVAGNDNPQVDANPRQPDDDGARLPVRFSTVTVPPYDETSRIGADLKPRGSPPGDPEGSPTVEALEHAYDLLMDFDPTRDAIAPDDDRFVRATLAFSVFTARGTKVRTVKHSEPHLLIVFDPNALPDVRTPWKVSKSDASPRNIAYLFRSILHEMGAAPNVEIRVQTSADYRAGRSAPRPAENQGPGSDLASEAAVRRILRVIRDAVDQLENVPRDLAVSRAANEPAFLDLQSGEPLLLSGVLDQLLTSIRRKYQDLDRTDPEASIGAGEDRIRRAVAHVLAHFDDAPSMDIAMSRSTSGDAFTALRSGEPQIVFEVLEELQALCAAPISVERSPSDTQG